jgi:hypothetical protein
MWLPGHSRGFSSTELPNRLKRQQLPSLLPCWTVAISCYFSAIKQFRGAFVDQIRRVRARATVLIIDLRP